MALAPDLQDQLGRALAAVRPDVIAAYLFGSQARGTAREDSDVDVAILVQGEPAPTLEGLGMDVLADLERDLGRRVDLVVLNRLAQAGWLQRAQSDRLRRLAGFRNLVVHGYAAVDPAIVRDVVENRLGDLVDFVAAIRARLSG
jgi:predicted nucleotidyltransferase